MKIKPVDHISLSIKKKEVMTIIGESGSGKTTLGLTMLMLNKPASGKIYFQGREITHLKIQLVTIKKLRWVRDKEYWEEGFSSPAAFEEVWKKMYGRFEPELDVCVLHFQRIRPL